MLEGGIDHEDALNCDDPQGHKCDAEDHHGTIHQTLQTNFNHICPQVQETCLGKYVLTKLT